VAGYSPKQNADGRFFALKFIAFKGLAGYSPKKNAADPKIL